MFILNCTASPGTVARGEARISPRNVLSYCSFGMKTQEAKDQEMGPADAYRNAVMRRGPFKLSWACKPYSYLCTAMIKTSWWTSLCSSDDVLLEPSQIDGKELRP